ncbi:MAG: TonB-dependent siderophore receptor [Dokdonella sp.]|uniref:TonB-dependent receptor n=1 Tax=Dokdonella sp. TaxID=2291710 RepID=UPI0032658649
MSVSFITSSHATPRRLLATALGTAFATTGVPALADVTSVDASSDANAAPDDVDSRNSAQLDSVTVEGHAPAQGASSKLTAPLLDTPQQITIVPQKIIAEQNLLNLRDILSTLPGITFGAGEGGGGYGDSINLRGFTGSNDITVDGVRDSAQYTRTDPFDLDHVELVNGANSVYSGSGSVGGSVNLVSKTPNLGNRTTIGAGVGTDSYGRVTVDSNQQIGDSTAFRLNVMAHENDAPGRDVENFRRWGIAPSIAFGLGTDTTLTLSYFHQHDDNVPQYGVPTYKGDVLPGVDREAYYGYRNFDTQQIRADALTSAIQHNFGSDFSLRNLTRVQRVTQFSRVDPPQGTFCLPDNLTPAGTSCTLNPGTFLEIVVPPGMYMPSGPRGNIRDTTNKILYNQTDLTANFNTGAIAHTLVAGVSLSHETYSLTGSSQFRNADGTNPYAAPGYFPFTPIGDPDSFFTGASHRTLTSKVEGDLDNAAGYVFDNLKFSDQWSLNMGARLERNDASATSSSVKLFTAPTVANPTPDNTGIGRITGANAPADNADTLFSYRAGLVFKPVENASVYVAYSNSKTPSAATVNGTCTAASTTGTANCGADPETAVNYELGAKWDVFDGRLSLTGSVFRNDRQNYRVADPGNPDNPSGQQTLDGRARVDGVLLGASGLLTDHWAIYANYSHLKSKVLQGASDFVGTQGHDYTKGDPLLSTPENSMSFWTTYDLSHDWQVGLGSTYVGRYTVSQHSAANVDGPLNAVDSYWTGRAMVAWKVNRNLALQFNVNNLFDEKYLTRVRTSGDIAWGTPGDARQAVLTATYTF